MTPYRAVALAALLWSVAPSPAPAVEGEVGLPLGVVRAPTVGRVDRGGLWRLTVVPANRVFEILPVSEGTSVGVLLWNDRRAWLPAAAIERVSLGLQLPPGRLAVGQSDRLYEPYRDLGPGVRYFWLLKEGAKLHVCVIDLAANPDLEFLPYTAAHFNSLLPGDERRNTIQAFTQRMGAVVGLNGPFFVMDQGAGQGEPLGNLIVRGQVAFELNRGDVLDRCRTYLAYTSAGRCVLGETEQPASAVLEANRQDEFDRTVFEPGERIVSMVGGLGWLARGGEPDAWVDVVEFQFGARFYSHKVRRPQTLIGLSDEGRTVTFLSQEGWPHSRRRMTLPELAHVMVSLGCTDVAFNDGGGSTEMVVDGRCVVRTEDCGPHRLNSTALLVLPRSGVRLAAAPTVRSPRSTASRKRPGRPGDRPRGR